MLLSLNICSCCRTFGRMLWFAGCCDASHDSNWYTSSRENIVFGILFMQYNISTIQLRVLMLSVSKNDISCTCAITSSLAIGIRLHIIPICPCLGILSKYILHPIHPALLAVLGNGFRFSTMFGTKKCFGHLVIIRTLNSLFVQIIHGFQAFQTVFGIFVANL